MTEKTLIKIMKDALQYLEKRLKFSDVVTAVEKNTKVLEKIKPAEAVDLTPLLKKLDTLKPIPPKERPVVSLDVVQAQLGAILEAIQRNEPERIGEKIDALDAVFKGLKPKESVRFDDTQMKGLMAALTGGRGITTVGDVDEDANPLKKYSIFATEFGATYYYICKEDKDGNWYIQRGIVSSGLWDYVKGSGDVETAWTDRASHTYQVFSLVF